MANNVFPYDVNSAPDCTICLEQVVDNGRRSITKLVCGHFFHTDCIGSEFNNRGVMICPNCRDIEEGDWIMFEESESDEDDYDDDDIDDDDEQYEEIPLTPEEEMDLRERLEVYNGGGTDNRSQETDSDSWTIDETESTPPNIHHSPLQITNNGCNIFSHTFVDENFTLDENEWIQYFGQELATLSLPPVAPVSDEASTSEGQACSNPLPSLELTLATGTSVGAEPPCQCIRCRRTY